VQPRQGQPRFGKLRVAGTHCAALLERLVRLLLLGVQPDELHRRRQRTVAFLHREAQLLLDLRELLFSGRRIRFALGQVIPDHRLEHSNIDPPGVLLILAQTGQFRLKLPQPREIRRALLLNGDVRARLDPQHVQIDVVGIETAALLGRLEGPRPILQPQVVSRQLHHYAQVTRPVGEVAAHRVDGPPGLVGSRKRLRQQSQEFRRCGPRGHQRLERLDHRIGVALGPGDQGLEERQLGLRLTRPLAGVQRVFVLLQIRRGLGDVVLAAGAYAQSDGVGIHGEPVPLGFELLENRIGHRRAFGVSSVPHRQLGGHVVAVDHPRVGIEVAFRDGRLGQAVGRLQFGRDLVILAVGHPLARQKQADPRVVGAVFIGREQVLSGQFLPLGAVDAGDVRKAIEARAGCQGLRRLRETIHRLVQPAQRAGHSLRRAAGDLQAAHLRAGPDVLDVLLRVGFESFEQPGERVARFRQPVQTHQRLTLPEGRFDVVRLVLQPLAGDVDQLLGGAPGGVDRRQLLVGDRVERVELDHAAVRADRCPEVSRLQRADRQPRLGVLLEDLDVVGIAAEVLLEVLRGGEPVALLEGGGPRLKSDPRQNAAADLTGGHQRDSQGHDDQDHDDQHLDVDLRTTVRMTHDRLSQSIRDCRFGSVHHTVVIGDPDATP